MTGWNMRLNVIAISIEDPADHVVGAVLSELLNMTFGDGELTPPPHEDAEIAEMAKIAPRAGTASPSPSLAAAAGTPGPGEPRPPARAAATARGGTGNPTTVNAADLDDHKREALVRAVNGRRKPGAARHLDEVFGAAGTGNPSGQEEAMTQAAPSATARKAGMLATPEEQRHFQNMHGAEAKTQPEDRVVKPGELPAALRSLKVGEEFIIRPAPKYTNGISRHVNHLRARGEIDRRIAVARDADGEVRVIFHSEQQA